MPDFFERSLQRHKETRGKIEVRSRMRLESQDDLSIAYTPGVARPCEVIAENPGAAWDLGVSYTMPPRGLMGFPRDSPPAGADTNPPTPYGKRGWLDVSVLNGLHCCCSSTGDGQLTTKEYQV